MRRSISNQNVFDIAKKQQTKPRPTPITTPEIAPEKLAPFDPELWPKQVEMMQRQIDSLKEQLKLIQKELGVSLDQFSSLFDQLTREQEIANEAHKAKRERDLDKLAILPSVIAERAIQKARQEKPERTARVVSKRKRWLSL